MWSSGVGTLSHPTMPGAGRDRRRRPVQQALPKPKLDASTDAIVGITKTTFCATDPPILKGDVPSCKPGRILGHEGIGVIDTAGSAVTMLKPGDRVRISCITACGKCVYCRKQMYSHCRTGGCILGNRINGTQAEFVRIAYADTSLDPLPNSVDEEALVMLSDILPTGFECGVLNGKVQPGGAAAIVGAGPIGLAAPLTAQSFAPASDPRAIRSCMIFSRRSYKGFSLSPMGDSASIRYR